MVFAYVGSSKTLKVPQGLLPNGFCSIESQPLDCHGIQFVVAVESNRVMSHELSVFPPRAMAVLPSGAAMLPLAGIRSKPQVLPLSSELGTFFKIRNIFKPDSGHGSKTAKLFSPSRKRSAKTFNDGVSDESRRS